SPTNTRNISAFHGWVKLVYKSPIFRSSSSAAPTAADAESDRTAILLAPRRDNTHHRCGPSEIRRWGICSADLFRETRRSPAEREVPQAKRAVLKASFILGGDRGFESSSLQRGVWCEPGFRKRTPSE